MLRGAVAGTAAERLVLACDVPSIGLDISYLEEARAYTQSSDERKRGAPIMRRCLARTPNDAVRLRLRRS